MGWPSRSRTRSRAPRHGPKASAGEERFASFLNQFASDDMVILHDCGIPGSRANIDHLIVTPAGVWVVDAKRYRGRPELRIEGGSIRRRVEKLMVNGRDCSKLVDGVLEQVRLVRSVVGDVPVHGVLCFTASDWPLFGGAFRTRDVLVLWPKRLAKLLRITEGTSDVATVRDLLADHLRVS